MFSAVPYLIKKSKRRAREKQWVLLVLILLVLSDLNMTARMKATTGTMLKMAEEDVAEA
jgi:hypothetical protein